MPIIIFYKNTRVDAVSERRRRRKKKTSSNEPKYRLTRLITYSQLFSRPSNPFHFDDINVGINRGRSKACQKKKKERKRKIKRKNKRKKKKAADYPSKHGNQLKHLKARDSCVIQRIFEPRSHYSVRENG